MEAHGLGYFQEFAKVVDDCVKELQERFKDGLEEKCRTGAVNVSKLSLFFASTSVNHVFQAASAALDTSDTFAASIHWATYRASTSLFVHYACKIFKSLFLALRRHGSWRSDLNVELSNPFTRKIASSWSKVFEADLFSSFEKAATTAISSLLQEVEATAAAGLKERARGQAELALDEAKIALKNTIGVVAETINSEQKEVSRCLAPHVQDQLIEAYDTAMLERGTGSVARQKVIN